MIKLKISDSIYLEVDSLPLDFRREIFNKFVFRVKTYKTTETKKLVEAITDENGVKWFKLPPNIHFVEDMLIQHGLKYQIEDARVCPKVETYSSGIQLHPLQQQMYKELKDLDFNALITAKTGFGKSLLAIYLGEILQTTMLFVATKTSFLTNMIKDCKKFGIDDKYITKLDAEWLKNPVITPIMYTTMQGLSEEKLQLLYGKVGLLVADEIHQGVTGDSNITAIGAINPKYRLYLSATPKHNVFEGLTETALSCRIVTAKENIDYDINVHTLNLIVDSEVHYKFNSTDKYHEKKEAIFTPEYCYEVAKLGAYLVKAKGRGVLIYLESNEGQEEIIKQLEEYQLKVGVLNSNRNKKHKEDVVNSFDSGKYDIVVGGTAISAGVSWYRLSTIIDVNLTINNNNLEQLVGRLKRKDDNICTKSKEFIKVTIRGLTDKKWRQDLKCLQKFSYIKFKEVENLEVQEELLDGLKRLEI